MRGLCAIGIILSTFPSFAAEPGLPELVAPQGVGVCIHFTGDDDKQVARIADAGFRFVRADFNWEAAERKQGSYDFKPYDGLMDALARHGLRAVVILCYGNPLYDGGLAPHTDEGRAAFGRFARACAERFRGKGILWEVWNEPDDGFWRPKADAGDYAKLAEVASRALKEGDPEAVVLGPAVSGACWPFLETAFQAGLLKSVDVVTVHPYGAHKPEDAADFFHKMREMIAKYAPAGKVIPLVNGEWGFASQSKVPIEVQAEQLARMMLTDMAEGVPLGLWYQWRDPGPEPKTEEPTCVAARTLAKELDGYSFAERETLESGEDYALVFRKGGSARKAAWTTGKAHTVGIALAAPKAILVSIRGERVEVQPKEGSLQVDLSGAVQYIEPLER